MARTDDDCENEWHRRALHTAVEADMVAEILMGLDLLLVGWSEFLAHTNPGADGHGRVTMALGVLLQACAERLRPPLPPTEATSPPEGSGPRLTVLPGGTPQPAASPDGA